MKRRMFTVTVAALLVTLMAGASWATVVTFDDLPLPPSAPNGNYGLMPTNYAGLTWSYPWAYMDTSTYTLTPSGYVNGVVSGTNIAFNGYESSVYVAPGSTFDFNGAYFAAAWNDNLNITIEGWLGSTKLYSQTIVAQFTGPAWTTLDYLNVDLVTFASSGGTLNPNAAGGGTHFVMDDMVYTKVIPAPAAIISALMGLMCLGGYRFRRLKA